MIKKKTLLFIIKAIVSLSLLTIIVININWDVAVKNFIRANFLFLFIAIILKIVERAELTYKWNLLIWARGIDISFGRLFLINLIGGFWGLFIPSSVGADVVRGYYLVKNSSEKSVSVSSIFVDRLLGMFSLLLLGVTSLIIAGDLVPGINIGLYVLFPFLGIIILFYFFQLEKSANYLKKLFGRMKYKKYTESITKLHFSILEYKKYPKALALSFLITLVVQVTRVVAYYFIAIAFNIHISIIYFFLFVPLVMLVIMIPISIGGLGVREGTFIAFFTLVGMSMNDAASISFTGTFFNTIVTLLGGVIYLFYNSPDNFPEKKELVFEDSDSLKREKTH